MPPLWLTVLSWAALALAFASAGLILGTRAGHGALAAEDRLKIDQGQRNRDQTDRPQQQAWPGRPTPSGRSTDSAATYAT